MKTYIDDLGLKCSFLERKNYELACKYRDRLNSILHR